MRIERKLYQGGDYIWGNNQEQIKEIENILDEKFRSKLECKNHPSEALLAAHVHPSLPAGSPLETTLTSREFLGCRWGPSPPSRVPQLLLLTFRPGTWLKLHCTLPFRALHRPVYIAMKSTKCKLYNGCMVQNYKFAMLASGTSDSACEAATLLTTGHPVFTFSKIHWFNVTKCNSMHIT